MITKEHFLTIFFWMSILAGLLSASCAGTHYVKEQGDDLTFYYVDAEASKVMFASSDDQYRFHSASRVSDDLWEVTVPLSSDFTYFYVVDGKVILPDCPDTVIDDYGGRNCIYVRRM